ncbi:DUF3576 domain-containing protein [Maritimibacter sp. DP1N21-5]|uniref:DUF3576 domain-containing protein n=1 Tax=Maritimibacter sp. DP1N21-5 TaxID=2836867 RepID=UPI001C479689|nr:DUF3576 domain-containing protein [Maritimibacter sp. DP1N21-5]MBV7408829.1 DUF3576 domain-containing protein [Maritimibacter sp. DP1N21-5]
MHKGRIVAKAGLMVSLMALTACSGGMGNFLGGNGARQGTPDAIAIPQRPDRATQRDNGDTIWDLFADRDDPNTTVEVNKYLWNASLDVLSFMPVESADPFTGVLVFGYGVPPGGGQAYRATVHVSDPALDARGLHVALQSRGGQSVSTETQHKIEDAILHRARQLRVQDINL